MAAEEIPAVEREECRRYPSARAEMPDETKKKQKLKITDRRSFTAEGELRSDRTEPEPSPPGPGPEDPVKGEGFEMHPGPVEPPRGSLPPVDFNSFLLSLSSTAFIHLGELEDPTSGKKQVNLDGARQMIDIIDMLREKTKNNLEVNEEKFITGILYELKMKYTQKATSK